MVANMKNNANTKSSLPTLLSWGAAQTKQVIPKEISRGWKGPYIKKLDLIDPEQGYTRDSKPPSSFGLPPVCMVILLVELCERLAFYTFTGTQESFLEHSGFTLSQSSGMTAAMSTLCMAWALLAGWVADVALGRYLTIVLFGLLYAAGSLVATWGAWPKTTNTKLYLVGVMALVPMGTAGIKANISNFGAEQYDVSIPSQKVAQERFFNWFYMSINLGSAVAYGYLTTMGSNGGLGVPKEYGYFAVYAIASVCMLLAVVAFASGQPYYRVQKTKSESAMGAVMKHVIVAMRKGSVAASTLCLGSVLVVMSIGISVIEAIDSESVYANHMIVAAFSCAFGGVLCLVGATTETSWIQKFRPDDEGQEKEGEVSPGDAGVFLRLLPTLIMGSLAFNALYNSMQYWYQQQACQMDLKAGGQQLAGSFFMIADCVGIVIATPIALGYVNPSLDRLSGGRFGHRAKFAMGMLLGGSSVYLAARMEVNRRLAPILQEISNCAPDGVHMSDQSAMLMFVPFLLMGIGEIYTQPVLMHFAYTNSPSSMRTFGAIVTMVIGAVSNALFTVQIAALKRYVPNDLNQGNLEYGYYANLLLGIIFFYGFVVAMGNFERRTDIL